VVSFSSAFRDNRHDSKTDSIQEPQDRSLRIGKRIVADVPANWKLIAENFSECFHCPPVHPELCRVVTAYRDAGAWGLTRDLDSKPEYKAGATTLTLDGSSRIPPFKHLTKQERKTLYVPAMLPPNLFLNVQPDYVNAHTMFPTGPESVRIVYDWLFEPAHMPWGKDLEHYTALWEVTNQQDARNCEWQQQGIRSREFRHGHYVPQEFDCLPFHAVGEKGASRAALGVRARPEPVREGQAAPVRGRNGSAN
jgi:Rieske 2Fe-2S family protein